MIWHHAFYSSRRLSSLFDNMTKISPLSFRLFLLLLLFLINIYPGAFNLAELVYNGALTQHRNKDIKTLRFFIIHTQKRSFMAVSSVRTKLDSFYLHISSFEKLPIWIWYPVPFVVNAILNLFNTHKMLSRQ